MQGFVLFLKETKTGGDCVITKMYVVNTEKIDHEKLQRFILSGYEKK